MSAPSGAAGGGSASDLVVPPEANGSRLDRFVTGQTGRARSEVQRWIEAGRVTVDTVVREASARLRSGQRVRVEPAPPEPTRAVPEPGVRFRILYQDDDIVVVDKPAALVVHPARGHESGTLVNGLLGLGLFRFDCDLLGSDRCDGDGTGTAADAHRRPGIVHRLDKGTSGVMVVARHAAAREALKHQFQAHTIERAYEAIAVGEVRAGTVATLHGRHPTDRLRFTSRVARGKRAVTHVRVLARLTGATQVECTLETGRTHQIRVHLAETGTPVLGDPLYGRPPRDAHVRAVAEALGHQALHARRLGFVHPRTGELVRFESDPPEDFVAALAALGPRSTTP